MDENNIVLCAQSDRARAEEICNIMNRGQQSTTVQTLIFAKEKFKSAADAKAWASKHDFKPGDVDETESSFRLRQRDPGDFKGRSFPTIELTEGVQAVVGHRKEGRSYQREHLLYRKATAEPVGDEKERTFNVAFSSEHPVARRAKEVDVELGAAAKVGERYKEVLSHADGDYDLAMMNNGGALLDEHEPTVQLGHVRNAEVSNEPKTVNRRGRAMIQFDGLTDLSQVRAAQMRSGSRRHVSFGYIHTRFLGNTALPDGTPAKRFAWLGAEISSVADPADPNAGRNRSRDSEADGEMAHCIHCGRELPEDDLDENGRCDECGPVARALSGRMVRSGGQETSMGELAAKVHVAASRDDRFIGKDNKGNPTGYIHIADLKHDGENWSAILYASVDGKHYQVEVEPKGEGVKLGEAWPVQHRDDWVAAPESRSVLAPDGVLFRADDEDAKKPYGDVKYADPGYQADGKKRYPIDTKAHVKAAWSYVNQSANAAKYSAKELSLIKGRIKAAAKEFDIEISEDRAQIDEWRRAALVDLEKFTQATKAAANTLATKVMSVKTVQELESESPDLLKSIRCEQEKVTRANMLAENNEHKRKLDEANAEIHTRANEAVKEYGKRWNGSKNAVIIVGEAIRRAEAEVCALELDGHDKTFRLQEFSRKLNLAIDGSYAPREMQEAGTLDSELADQCSLRRLWDKANEAFTRGDRRPCFMLTDGAEFEADKELRNRAGYFPGGLGYSPEGLILPSNLRGHLDPTVRRNLDRVLERALLPKDDRMTRDALLADFGTLGALVPPKYMPPIELLRNKLALAKAGVTIIGGVVGNPLTFPRLTAPTTAQSLAEGTAAAQYDQQFDQVKLTPHRIVSSQNYSRLGMSQAPGFEPLVWDDHMQVHAIKSDYLGLNGAGANDEPLGILNNIGIGAIVFNGVAATAYKNAIALETNIRKANIDEPPTFLTTSTARGMLRVVPAQLVGATIVSGATNAIYTLDDGNDFCVGRPAVDSQQVPNDILLAIVGRHILFAIWAGLNVVLDTITRADRDQFRLTLNQYIDWGMRHPQAAARSVDSLAVLA